MYHSTKIHNKKITISIITVLIPIFSIITSLFLAINTANRGYDFYFLVPLLFGALFLLCKSVRMLIFERLGLTVMVVVMTFRYVVLPFVACLGGYSVRVGVTPSNELINLSVILTLMEMIVIFVTSTICVRVFSKNKYDEEMLENNKFIDECLYFNSTDLSQRTKKIMFIAPIKSSLVYNLIIVLAIIAMILLPEVISDYRFIFSSNNITQTIRVDFPMAGLFKTIINFAQFIMVLLVINYSYKKYMFFPRFRYVIYAMIAVLISMTVTSNLSRFTILIPTVTFTYLLTKLFPREKKKIIFIIFGCLLTGLVFLTTIKFFGEGRGSSNSASDVTWWADTLQMYFAGPKNIAIALKANPLVESTYGLFRIKLFITDLFNNVALVSNYVPTEINSIHIFNYSYYDSNISVDQIPPFIGTGYFYLGFILAPLWTGVSILILFLLDKKALNSKYIDQKFLYSYVSVYFGLATILSTSTVYSILINVLVLFLVILVLNKKIVLKKTLVN